MNIKLKKSKAAKKSNNLSKLVEQINKGLKIPRACFLMNQASEKVDCVPTGLPSLEVALGVPGLPKGRIVELYGPESAGKTTLALQCLAEAQKAGETCGMIDAEHALDPSYAKSLGVDLDNVVMSQPDSAEQAIDIARAWAKGGISFIVLDSVAAMVPMIELETSAEKNQMGLQAKLMSKMMRQLVSPVSKAKCVLLCLNQIRMKIGVMFGNPETTTGGLALKFAASVRIEVRKGEPIKSGDGVIGNFAKVKIVKNKVAKPFQTTELRNINGKGFDKVYSIVVAAQKLGIIERNKRSYSFDGDVVGTNEKDMIKRVRKDNDLQDNLLERIRDGT